MSRPAPIFLVFFLLFLSSCHVVRYGWWNFAAIHDGKKFPEIPVAKSNVSKSFNHSESNIKISLPDSFVQVNNPAYFESFLEGKGTVAFLVLRNDSIIYERYFAGYSRESLLPSFSIAKSFVSAMVGIAIADGKIKSVDQPVSDFIPEIAEAGFNKVTIRNLLEMRSGIGFTEEYANPFGEMAKFYYGTSLRKYCLKLKSQTPPGEFYNYQSANTQILALVLERATGMKLPDYLSEKLWRPMGTEYDASWNVDSKRFMEPKAFCCLNARAEDFAKFGELFLHHGLIGTDTIVSPAWIDESLKITNDSRDSQGYPYTTIGGSRQRGIFLPKAFSGNIYIYVLRKMS